jgi:hypothetical protein
MYMHRLRDKPEMDWTEFKRTTSMGEIKAFADLINDEQPDPTNGEIQPTS